jgi:hypothetical protein
MQTTGLLLVTVSSLEIDPLLQGRAWRYSALLLCLLFFLSRVVLTHRQSTGLTYANWIPALPMLFFMFFCDSIGTRKPFFFPRLSSHFPRFTQLFVLYLVLDLVLRAIPHFIVAHHYSTLLAAHGASAGSNKPRHTGNGTLPPMQYTGGKKDKQTPQASKHLLIAATIPGCLFALGAIFTGEWAVKMHRRVQIHTFSYACILPSVPSHPDHQHVCTTIAFEGATRIHQHSKLFCLPTYFPLALPCWPSTWEAN